MTASGNPPTSPLAGLRPVDHYKSRLPSWRHALREKVLPIIRWETPYLAVIQNHVRTPTLDSYFALTANLGTHAFFVALLPLSFWFGYTTFGRGIVHVLCLGVFITGFLKDLFCLPRPLSPPLHRITMSGSAALEYGFPSTHSANSVAVLTYALLYFETNKNPDPSVRALQYFIAALYGLSIVLGRIYCGMHGFLDVIIGSLVGCGLAVFEYVFAERLENILYNSGWIIPVGVILVAIILVRVHPEPADPCPCFDDGVACIGVVAGVNIGNWRYSQSTYSTSVPTPGTVPYSYEQLGFPKAALRLVIGLFIVFSWREVVKPLLHFTLPPLFRFFEHVGLSVPRRDFLQATQYKKVPKMPEESILHEVPTLVRNIRRSRADSVGPQSAADAYETLAYREKKRRESIGNLSPGLESPREGLKGVEKAENEMGSGGLMSDDPADDAAVFLKIERPRVRYDVEVVTKLLVYGGLAYIVTDMIPIFLELVGLGCGKAYM